jgi:hypothetical protein
MLLCKATHFEPMGILVQVKTMEAKPRAHLFFSLLLFALVLSCALIFNFRTASQDAALIPHPQNKAFDKLQGRRVPINFLSFDLGGSGLKLLPLSVSGSTRDSNVTIVEPIGDELHLGYIPPNANPSVWVQQVVQNLSSIFPSIMDWSDFALADNVAYKLWSPHQSDAITKLRKTGNLEIACEGKVRNTTSHNHPTMCSKWRSSHKVLGFQKDNPKFRASFTDGMAHFEGSRAKLEHPFPFKEGLLNWQAGGDAQSPFLFVNWGLGTGQTVSWVNDHDSNGNVTDYNPAHDRTAAGRPNIVSEDVIANAISSRPADKIWQIMVDIPPEILQKNITLDQHRMHARLPFHVIMAGRLWVDTKTISNTDLGHIYRTFFRDQVLTAIDRGDLPKPQAMIFSGGLQEHFGIAELLRDVLEAQGIQSVAGYTSAAHCGIFRLANPEKEVKCNFE